MRKKCVALQIFSLSNTVYSKTIQKFYNEDLIKHILKSELTFLSCFTC